MPPKPRIVSKVSPVRRPPELADVAPSIDAAVPIAPTDRTGTKGTGTKQEAQAPVGAPAVGPTTPTSPTRDLGPLIDTAIPDEGITLASGAIDPIADARTAIRRDAAGERQRLREQADTALFDAAADNNGPSSGFGSSLIQSGSPLLSTGTAQLDREDNLKGSAAAAAEAEARTGLTGEGVVNGITAQPRLLREIVDGIDGKEAPAPPPAPVTEVIKGAGRTFVTTTSPDGKVVETRQDADGTITETTTTTNKDGSTTTTKTRLEPNDDGTFDESTSTDTRPPTVGQPDGDAFVAPVGQVVEDRLRAIGNSGAGVVGNGDIDFADDNFGAGATGGAIPDLQGSLLGGNTRGADFGGGVAGGSIPSPINKPGALDFEEGSPGFGARQDDPLADLDRPAAAFPTQSDDDEEADSGDGSAEASAGAADDGGADG